MSCGSGSGENVMFSNHIQSLLLTSSSVPELRIYKVWDKPIGPHPMGMFEVNLFTPGM